MIGCTVALAVLVFSDYREAARASTPPQSSPPTRAEIRAAPDPDRWTAEQATSALALLMAEGCIKWHDVDERHQMTCGDTLPALKVVSYEMRNIP
jgi:hypothetical protein